MEEFILGEVKTLEVKERTVHQLLLEMSDVSFQGRALGEAYRVLIDMFEDSDNTIFMGLAGSMSTSGMWRIVKWFVENRYVDVLVSTGANISEDIVEAMGFKYYKTYPTVDDAKLLERKFDRFYDTVVNELEYRRMEGLIGEFIETLPEGGVYSTMEFLYLFGKFLNEKGIDSIVSAAYRAGVPVFSPALVDSGYGIAAVLKYRRGHRIVLDMVKDFAQLVEIGLRSKKISAIYIGGGVPKDYVNLVAVANTLVAEYEQGEHDYYKPLEYVVQFTTDSPQWGGLSGATLEEAVSWGKVSPRAKKRVVYVDATIALPLISHGLVSGGVKRRRTADLSWLFSELEKR
ncbi:putative deoxyhypusine synthase [Thermogladius calderae 1633]|uniref:Putative deoxyhypusine synthase n=1 Tax=Thermogladius calderae (strain DSM 22663 / VKM B-2946 / 1633) TaxID=1184251 RepID=I3TE54_THEC1|nr:deoxyhypusine synthase [Thermogladius calderae]AFK51042.1 putative deoxyhypusine synthase [Thermogladius calderae 1633]